MWSCYKARYHYMNNTQQCTLMCYYSLCGAVIELGPLHFIVYIMRKFYKAFRVYHIHPRTNYTQTIFTDPHRQSVLCLHKISEELITLKEFCSPFYCISPFPFSIL